MSVIAGDIRQKAAKQEAVSGYSTNVSQEVAEYKTQREANVKHYVLSRTFKAVVYPEAVHFKDEKEQMT